MANQVDVQIIADGYRNAVVRITGFMDTQDIVLSPAFAVTDFQTNDPGYTKLVGFRIDWLQYAVDPDIVVKLTWSGNTPQLLAVLADSNDLSFKESGGLFPNQQNSGYDGSISLSTQGYTPGAQTGFTCVMTMVKLYQR